MMFFFLFASAVFLLFVNLMAFCVEKTGVRRATLCSLVAIFPFLLCGISLALPVNALLVTIAGLLCWAVGARPRWFLICSLAVTIACYALIAHLELRAWERLKSEYPLESLAGRLAYEERPRPASHSAHDMTGPSSGRLVRLEMRYWQDDVQFPAPPRVRSLERLHAGVVKQFIDSPDFGMGRMRARPPKPYVLEEEVKQRREAIDNSAIPQPSPAYSPVAPDSAEVEPTTEAHFLAAHHDNLFDFLNPERFGFVRSREKVAGFLPHQFRSNPQGTNRWRVQRLELLGLLKFDEPVVYLSPYLPRMDELSTAPTRSLDAFEKKALEGLLAGEDLMVQRMPRRLRILGSLRAMEQCVKCHHVQRGELLGAFSYLMIRDEASSK
jgi:hypothetical protein